MLASDLVVAARDARFGSPEVKRGVVANTGALFRAGVRLAFNMATEMLPTGDPIDAECGHAVGVVHVLTEPGATLEAALALTARIVVNSPDAVAISLGTVAREVASARLGRERTAAADAEIAESPDRIVGVTAFFEKRPPNWA